MPRNLRLEIINGPLTGKVVIVPEQATLLIGRLPECGLSFPQDLTVSRQHCRIEVHPSKCVLVHLSQTGETFVNGVSATNEELRHGDDIELGAGNRLLVAFEDVREEVGAPTAVSNRFGSDSDERFTASVASCGWNLYESEDEQPDFERLFKILTSTQKASVLIDFRRLGIPAPADLIDPKPLFSWMPIPTRDQFSPVLISLSENASLVEIILAGREKDAIISFGSKLKGSELVAHWQKAIGAENGQPGAAITAYYWPSILNMILTCQSAEQVAPLLSDLTWIFVENPKSPGKWRLFAKADFGPELTKSGLVPVPVPATTK